MNCNRTKEKCKVIQLLILLCSTTTNGALLPSTSLSLQEIHLVRCLTYISHRYFAPGRSVVISSPSTYRDVQQELIVEIHRTALWPVVVTVDGNISKTTKTDFVDRGGSYIILIPDGNLERFLAEFKGLSLGRENKFKIFWNSEARFVVAGAKFFSKSQQLDILDFLSKLRIYNCIILSQEHYVKDKEKSRPIYDNAVDTGMKFGVYTWFPYQSSDRCTEVNDITLLDSWVISAQGHFTHNTELFPVKINKSFYGCPMKAVIRDQKSVFATKYVNYRDSNGTVVTKVVGLEMDLLRIVLQQMNMSLAIVLKTEFTEGYKVSLTNIINGMFKKQIYIILGNIPLFALIEELIASTNMHYNVNIRWYVPCSIKLSRWSSIFRILSVELWLLLMISIVVTAISSTLLRRYSCTSEWQGYKTVTSSLTNVWAVLLGVSVSTMPHSPSLRSLFLAWVCFSLAFSTVIQSFLTTFLIYSGYEKPIQNMDELFASGIKLAYLPGYSYIFENGDEAETSKVQRNLVNCPSFGVCANWAKYQKNVSVLLADQIAEMDYAEGNFVGETSEPLLCRLEDGVVSNTGLSMLMLHADPLLKRVTEIIDRMAEAGIYKYWISLRFHRLKLHAQKIAIVQPLDGYYSFNLYHLQPAFYILLIGLCLSAFCFKAEMLYNRVLSKRV